MASPAPPLAARLRGALSPRAPLLWTVAGNFVFAAAQWGLTVVLARGGSPEAVGLFALGLAVTAPVFSLAGLQLRGAQATDARGEHRPEEYVALRALGVGLGLLVTAALALTVYRGAAPVLLWLGLAKVFEGLSDVLYGTLQARDRLRDVAVSLMFRGPLGLLLLWLGFRLGGLPLGAAGLALANALGLLLVDLPRVRAGGLGDPRRVEWGRVARLARLTLPLGVVIGLVSLSAVLPRFFVERDLGGAPLGVFAALSYVVVAAGVLVNAVGQAVSAPLARLFGAGDLAAFWRLLAKLLGFGALLGALGVGVALVGGAPLLSLLYGPEYAREADAFVWLMLAGAASYVASFAGYAITAVRRFKEQLPLFALVVLALWLGCEVLVPRAGLVGAAVATLLASLVQLAGALWIVSGARPRPEAS